MSAAELLTKLATHGITLEIDGGTLRYHAVEGALTPELRERIKAHQAELLTYLTKDAANTIADPVGPCPGGSNASDSPTPAEGRREAAFMMLAQGPRYYPRRGRR